MHTVCVTVAWPKRDSLYAQTYQTTKCTAGCSAYLDKFQYVLRLVGLLESIDVNETVPKKPKNKSTISALLYLTEHF